uniref:Uncharacterized protein n=1 Tax=Naja naja TaxID=35670 RepID=A0A8C6Y063_NAJNA
MITLITEQLQKQSLEKLKCISFSINLIICTSLLYLEKAKITSETASIFAVDIFKEAIIQRE